MRFFFVDEAPPRLEGPWEPPADLARHLKALRLRPEEDFLLLLPRGGAARAQWEGRDRVRLLGLTEVPRLPLLPVTLATAWPKAGRADELVVRAAEHGVERIVPLVCERSVAGRRPFSETRIARWEKLARAACEQCGRPLPPTLEGRPVQLESLLDGTRAAHSVVLTPGARPLAVELGLRTPRELLLIVGPEGGLSPRELEQLQERGAREAGLAPTVLRIEAAGPFAAGIAQHWFYQSGCR